MRHGRSIAWRLTAPCLALLACGAPRSVPAPTPAAVVAASSSPAEPAIASAVPLAPAGGAPAELDAGASGDDASVSAEADAADPFAWLPALSADGRKVAFGITDLTGPRVTPYFAVGTKDVAHDLMGQVHVIHDGEDPERPGHDARVNAARRALARDRFTPLAPYAVREDEAAPERQGGLGAAFRANLAEGEGLVVRYREPWLTVTDERGREVLHRKMTTYSKHGGARCKGCVECSPPLANLKDAHGARARGVLLLEIEYRGGTDLCWEPAPTVHAVTL